MPANKKYSKKPQYKRKNYSKKPVRKQPVKKNTSQMFNVVEQLHKEHPVSYLDKCLAIYRQTGQMTLNNHITQEHYSNSG